MMARLVFPGGAEDLLESWAESPFTPNETSSPPYETDAVDVAFTAKTPRDQPSIIGLYGVSGCGKSYLLNLLQTDLHEHNVLFIEGSDAIAEVVIGSQESSSNHDDHGVEDQQRQAIEKFNHLDEAARNSYRASAINSIKSKCSRTNKSAIVTGHYMFWSEGQAEGETVCTPEDLQTYTSIVYIDTPEDKVLDNRRNDQSRAREPLSPEHLRKWASEEKRQLRKHCREHGILFCVIPDLAVDRQKAAQILDFLLCTVEANERMVLEQVDATITCNKQPQSFVVFDADKTLAPQDTGSLFWEHLTSHQSQDEATIEDPVSLIFKHPTWQYSHAAFQQATLSYEEAATSCDFQQTCQTIAAKVELFQEFVPLLKNDQNLGHSKALIVTSGLRRVWERVLLKNGLLDCVDIIGNGRVGDGHVVDPDVKGKIVRHLQKQHNMRVWAFGDSPIDIPMLLAADHAVVVVIEERIRSKTMDSKLRELVMCQELSARQLLIPRTVTPRLDAHRLPLLDSAIHAIKTAPCLEVHHLTGTRTAEILMTPMRDARCQGAELRRAHEAVGWYLAMNLLVDILGTEVHQIQHVQGHRIAGHQFHKERTTMIVAMMRGGEPMAFGVNKALPKATFRHAHSPADLELRHLEGQDNVILVDSVVNEGRSVAAFIKQIRLLSSRARIIVMAGVVQADSVRRGSMIQVLSKSGHVDLVTLRLSENKYKGTRGTDTGNRLFQTTNLD